MGANRDERGEIADLEDIAAVLNAADQLLAELAEHITHPDWLRRIQDRRKRLAAGIAIIHRRRANAHRRAGG